MKAYENKVVTETTWLRDAVLNAEYNANRKKHKPFRKLWHKLLKIDQSDAVADINLIKHIESKDKNKEWVKLIYKNSGIKQRQKGA